MTRAIALQLAAALDADDYSTVAALIHKDCAYDAPRGPMKGRREITGSYYQSSRWARDRFDVRYASRIVDADDERATIEFEDHLERNGQRHLHTCRQTFTFREGLVVHIVHHDLPGEKERLEDYFLAVQVARDLTPTASDWGINFKTVHCPDCFARMPGVRFPKSLRQVLWGGWTCPECGCELDKFGKALVRRVKRPGDQSSKR